MVPTCRALGVLRQQRAVAAAAAAAAVVAAWVGQAPGGPGLSLQPGPTLSLLKCAEASTIAPERGQCDIKQTKRKQDEHHRTEEHRSFHPHPIIIK